MRVRPTAGDLSGAVADLGVMVPLVAALVLINGLHPGSVLLAAGVLVIVAGVVFRVPFPVQPLKALTALAVAQGLSAETIHAAGLQIGAILLALAALGLADRLARLFTLPVIRSLQFAVGVLLIVSAVRMVATPPDIFEGTPAAPWALALAAVTAAVVAVAAATRRYLIIGGLLTAGVALGAATADLDLGTVGAHLPGLALPPASVFAGAFVLLVVPQIPLTYGNAVVGVSHLARQTFGDEARRVTPGRVALTCGLGNVASAAIGGMPMCHGSSGFTAHVRLGARTAAMNLALGTVFVVLGLVFSNQILALFGILPVWVLGGFLAYAGIRHALLVADLRRTRLGIALGAGLIGVVTGNLAFTTAVALVAEHGPAMRRRFAGDRPAEPLDPASDEPRDD
jgi:sulfate permease, SulP family